MPARSENSAVGTVIIPFQRPMSVLLKLIFMRKTGTYLVQREAATLMERTALNIFSQLIIIIIIFYCSKIFFFFFYKTNAVYVVLIIISSGERCGLIMVVSLKTFASRLHATVLQIDPPSPSELSTEQS